MIVHANWIPNNCRQKYIDENNYCEKFLKEIPGVGDKLTRQIVQKVHSEGEPNDVLGIFKGFRHQGVLYLSKENGLEIGQVLSQKIYNTFMNSDKDKLL